LINKSISQTPCKFIKKIGEVIFILNFAANILRILPMFPQKNRLNPLRPVLVLYTLIVYGLQYTFTGIVVLIGIGCSYLRLTAVVKTGQYFGSVFGGGRILINPANIC